MALTCHIFVDIHPHFSVRLITSHMSENGRADGTLRPVLLPNEHEQAVPVILMRASKHENIVILFLSALLLDIFDDELLKADHALLILHLILAQRELNRMEVAYIKCIMIVFPLSSVLLINEWDDKLDTIEEMMVVFDGILGAQVYFLLVLAHLLHEELSFALLTFHTYKKNVCTKSKSFIALRNEYQLNIYTKKKEEYKGVAIMGLRFHMLRNGDNLVFKKIDVKSPRQPESNRRPKDNRATLQSSALPLSYGRAQSFLSLPKQAIPFPYRYQFVCGARVKGSIVGVLGRLLESLVCQHFVLQCHQNGLYGRCVFPCLQQAQSLDSSICLVHRWQAHLVCEGQHWRLLGIFGTAVNRQPINSVLEVRLSRKSATLNGPRMVPFQLVSVISSAKLVAKYTC